MIRGENYSGYHYDPHDATDKYVGKGECKLEILTLEKDEIRDAIEAHIRKCTENPPYIENITNFYKWRRERKSRRIKAVGVEVSNIKYRGPDGVYRSLDYNDGYDLF